MILSRKVKLTASSPRYEREKSVRTPVEMVIRMLSRLREDLIGYCFGHSARTAK